MLCKPFGEVSPELDAGAYVAENATLIGKVKLEKDSSVWYGAVLRGDTEEIVVGQRSNLQDGVIVHTSHGTPCRVGEDVTVGHGAILHSCDIGPGSLIGMGSILLTGSKIGAGCLIAAGALVTEGREIPPNSVVMGCPGKIVRQTTEEERASFLQSARHYAENAKTQFGGQD